MKVALVHDYLRDYNDAERVLEGLHRLYPNAPVYTAFVDRSYLGSNAARFDGWDIRPTFAQALPLIRRHPQLFRNWLPYFWESLDLSAFDVVISSSGPFASKSVLTQSETLHICYCHTPPRYLWESPHAARHPRWYNTWVDTALRHYDFYTAQRVDRFVTNSHRVARRISKFYGRVAEVIPPPVPIRGEGKAGSQYYLYQGSLNCQDRVDRVIAACNQLDRPLWVMGTGTEAERLRKRAGDRTRFLDPTAVESLDTLYEGARALICPDPDADFSFAAVEAMGRGVPVMAPAQSGIREIVLDYRTGLLFKDASIGGLCDAILQFESLRFSASACIQRAEEFATSVFSSKLEWLIAQAIDDYQHHGARARD